MGNLYIYCTVYCAHKVSLDNFIFSGGEFRRDVLIQKSYMYEVQLSSLVKFLYINVLMNLTVSMQPPKTLLASNQLIGDCINFESISLQSFQKLNYTRILKDDFQFVLQSLRTLMFMNIKHGSLDGMRIDVIR